MKNKKSPEEIAQMRKQDYITNKLLLVFTIAFVFMMYIMSLDNSKSTFEGFFALGGKVQTALWISVGIFAAGVVWMIVEKFIVKRDTECKLFTGMHLAVVSLFAVICMLDLNSRIGNDANAFTRIYVFIPLVVALYIIYSSYQREFFFVALAAIFGGVAIWNMEDYVFGDPTKIIVLAAVAIAVVVVLTVLAQKGKLAFFKSDAKYGLVYASYAVVLALLAAAFFFAGIAMYFAYAVAAYLVIVGIYYTIKLI